MNSEYVLFFFIIKLRVYLIVFLYFILFFCRKLILFEEMEIELKGLLSSQTTAMRTNENEREREFFAYNNNIAFNNNTNHVIAFICLLEIQW